MTRKINVFIASPGDLTGERRAFKTAIDLLNIGFGDGAGVEFVPLAWEETLSSYGRRPQGVIRVLKLTSLSPEVVAKIPAGVEPVGVSLRQLSNGIHPVWSLADDFFSGDSNRV